MWAILSKAKNRAILSWAVLTYIWPAHEKPGIVCAQQGSIAAGRNASGNTITNTFSGGAAPSGSLGSTACTAAAKK
jgi:hypothetical protein